jgi:hypothetical protein
MFLYFLDILQKQKERKLLIDCQKNNENFGETPARNTSFLTPPKPTVALLDNDHATEITYSQSNLLSRKIEP